VSEQTAEDFGPVETEEFGPVEPVAPTPPASQPTSLTAYRAARGPAPEQAARALGLAATTGLGHQFVADNLDEIGKAQEEAQLAAHLDGMPVTAAYAGQSAVHAAAVKDDVGVLEALEMGLSDVGYALKARSEMDQPTPGGAATLQGYEEAAAEFGKRPSGLVADVARAIPSTALYGAAAIMGGVLTGPGAPAGAAGGLTAALYQLNRGVLYRRIWAQAPIPEEGGDFDPAAFDARAKEYAKKGAIVSGTLGALLGDAFTRALPGVNAALGKLGVDIVAKGWGEVLKDWTGHTLSGALMMGGQAAADDATVQNATTGKIDVPEALHAGVQAFKDGLAVAAVLSATTPGKKLLTDLGRIHNAPAEVAQLDHLVEQAKESKLVQRAPAEAEKLIGNMVADTPTVFIDGEKAQEHAAKLVEVLADEGQALTEAQAIGGDVAVPMEKYLTQMGDEHAELREHVKLSPEGASLTESAELAKTTEPLPGGVVERDLAPILDNDVRVARLDGSELAALPRTDRGEIPIGELTRWLKEHVAGAYLNSHTRWVIDATAKGIREAAAEGHIERPVLPAIPEMLLDAILHRSEPDIRDRSSVLASHVLYAPVSVGGELFRVGLRVNETRQGFKFYGLAAEKLERPASMLSGTEGSKAPAGTLGPPGTMKVRELLEGVKAPEPPKSGGGGGGGQPVVTAQIDGRAAAEWAKQLIDTRPIGEIHPGRYELAARRAEDKLAAIAKEAAEKGTTAARQAFLASGIQNLDSPAPTAGEENLRSAGRKADAADRRLDKVPMLERARDLARAEAAHAADVREEMDKAREYIVSRDTPKHRGELALAGPEFLGAWDALQDVIDDNTPRAPPNPQALLALVPKLPLIGFDAEGLLGLFYGDRGWKKLTPPEARNVLDAAKNIRFAAHLENEIRLSDQTYTVRETVGTITSEASTRKDLGSPPLTDSATSPAESIARIAGLINAANLKPETIFERLGDTAQRFYEDKLIAARNRKAELQGEHLKYFIEHFDKEMRGLRKWLREPVATSLTIPEGVDLDGSKVNNETLAMAFLNLGSPGNEQRLLSGYGWDAAQIREEIGKYIPKEKLRFLQGILSYNDEKLWPLIREHAESHTGVAPPKVQAQPITIHFPDGTSETFPGGYFPAAPNRRALGVPEHMQAALPDGAEPDQGARLTVQAAFTNERAKKANYPIDLNWSRYPQHLASVFHYLAYDDAVRDVGKLLRDGEFQKTVRHYVGEPYFAQLKQDQKIWARGSVGDTSGTLSYLDRLFGSLFRTRAVSNALAFSTPIALGQESHIQYAITSGQISLKNATAAMTRQLPFTDTWVATRAILEEVRFRSDRYADDFREAISGQPARTLLGHGVDRAAFAQMEAADSMLSHVIGDAALNDALDAGKPMDEAIREANRKVRLLMPTHNVMEMAPIVRSRGTVGALMLFRGLPNVVWNVESGLYDEARQGLAGASGAPQIAAAGGRIALNSARAVASLAVLHMLGRLLMGHGKKDEDGEGVAGWATWAEREAISSQFSRIPLGRDVMEPFVDAYFHDKSPKDAIRELASGQHLAPDVAVIHGILKDLGKIASDSSEPEDRVQASVNTALTALGVGGRQITRTGRYAYDLQQGNVEARGPGDVVGGLIYGQRQRQEKNPATAAQDLVSGE
jgi:hypothetical protein